MRPSASASTSTYVCLPCLLRNSKPSRVGSIHYDAPIQISQRHASHASVPSELKEQSRQRRALPKVSNALTQRRCESTSSTESVSLSKAQLSKIGTLYRLKNHLQKGVLSISGADGDSQRIPIEQVLSASKTVDPPPDGTSSFIQTLEQVYAGKTYGEVSQDLSKLSNHRRPSDSTVTDNSTISILSRLGVIEEETKAKAASSKPDKKKSTGSAAAKNAEGGTPTKAKGRRRAKAVEGRKAQQESALSKGKARRKLGTVARKPGPAVVRKHLSRSPETASRAATGKAQPERLEVPSGVKRIDGSLITQQAIETDKQLKVPQLSFGLSRVLFNPGVYHLRDPRSRVYNFDPYLEKIMPVTEFNFDALNPYITSSQDDLLRSISMEHKKRYIGSSSSMTAAMSHFHFLLSAWRPIDPSILSQKIKGLHTFTTITRAPASIFLRWRNGVYAIDADKEFDTPNILMMQGKSMEKLLTSEKEEFEKYRKPKAGEEAPAIDSEPEAYHYSTVEDFLLRSQLDAYDPRLPGSGMFDLKTRAVAGVRMLMREYETGMNYQIKDRFGMWESYDREYYDMIRAAFLKYSLQVRMGRMDGIFVAYHNISRIFGFQYISLTEFDLALHGQADPCLGNQEFKTTLKLMNEIFDQATKEYPEQSLRILFETRESTKTDPNGTMRIFVDPMDEAEIDQLQKAGKERVEEYEKKMTEGIDPTKREIQGQTIEEKLAPSTLESNAPDEAFLEQILGDDAIKSAEDSASSTPAPAAKQVACWTLSIFNTVNGKSVIRPTDITPDDRWEVHYKLERKKDEKFVNAAYTSSRNRRSAALSFDEATRRNNYFLQKLRGLSESGKVWREEQDAIDAQQGKVVLYTA